MSSPSCHFKIKSPSVFLLLSGVSILIWGRFDSRKQTAHCFSFTAEASQRVSISHRASLLTLLILCRLLWCIIFPYKLCNYLVKFYEKNLFRWLLHCTSVNLGRTDTLIISSNNSFLSLRGFVCTQ